MKKSETEASPGWNSQNLEEKDVMHRVKIEINSNNTYSFFVNEQNFVENEELFKDWDF
jgi:hypothetical protein